MTRSAKLRGPAFLASLALSVAVALAVDCSRALD